MLKTETSSANVIPQTFFNTLAFLNKKKPINNTQLNTDHLHKYSKSVNPTLKHNIKLKDFAIEESKNLSFTKNLNELSIKTDNVTLVSSNNFKKKEKIIDFKNIQTCKVSNSQLLSMAQDVNSEDKNIENNVSTIANNTSTVKKTDIITSNQNRIKNKNNTKIMLKGFFQKTTSSYNSNIPSDNINKNKPMTFADTEYQLTIDRAAAHARDNAPRLNRGELEPMRETTDPTTADSKSILEFKKLLTSIPAQRTFNYNGDVVTAQDLVCSDATILREVSASGLLSKAPNSINTGSTSSLAYTQRMNAEANNPKPDYKSTTPDIPAEQTLQYPPAVTTSISPKDLFDRVAAIHVHDPSMRDSFCRLSQGDKSVSLTINPRAELVGGQRGRAFEVRLTDTTKKMVLNSDRPQNNYRHCRERGWPPGFGPYGIFDPAAGEFLLVGLLLNSYFKSEVWVNDAPDNRSNEHTRYEVQPENKMYTDKYTDELNRPLIATRELSDLRKSATMGQTLVVFLPDPGFNWYLSASDIKKKASVYHFLHDDYTEATRISPYLPSTALIPDSLKSLLDLDTVTMKAPLLCDSSCGQILKGILSKHYQKIANVPRPTVLGGDNYVDLPIEEATESWKIPELPPVHPYLSLVAHDFHLDSLDDTFDSSSMKAALMQMHCFHQYRCIDIWEEDEVTTEYARETIRKGCANVWTLENASHCNVDTVHGLQ